MPRLLPARALLAGALLTVPLVVLPAPTACACSCAAVPTARHVADADLVARVTVQELGRPSWKDQGSSGAPVRHVMEVRSVYRGEAGSRIQVTTAASGGSCGLEGLEVGKDYLLFADGKGQDVRASLCDGTQPWRESTAAEVVRITGAPHQPGPAQALPREGTRHRLAGPAGGGLLVLVLAGVALAWRRRVR